MQDGRVTTKGSRSDTVDTSAWPLAAAVFLTGENETAFGFSPKSPFEIGEASRVSTAGRQMAAINPRGRF
jgi:hypothetical protein